MGCLLTACDPLLSFVQHQAFSPSLTQNGRMWSSSVMRRLFSHILCRNTLLILSLQNFFSCTRSFVLTATTTACDASSSSDSTCSHFSRFPFPPFWFCLTGKVLVVGGDIKILSTVTLWVEFWYQTAVRKQQSTKWFPSECVCECVRLVLTRDWLPCPSASSRRSSS